MVNLLEDILAPQVMKAAGNPVLVTLVESERKEKFQFILNTLKEKGCGSLTVLLLLTCQSLHEVSCLVPKITLFPTCFEIRKMWRKRRQMSIVKHSVSLILFKYKNSLKGQ